MLGLNFRGTAGYVTDPTDSTYVLDSDVYPTTRGGFTFGWTAGAASLIIVNRSTANDPRIAGVALILNDGTRATLRIDLPGGAGNYNLTLAVGDTGGGSTNSYVEILDSDGTTQLHLLHETDTVYATYHADATGVSRWSADFFTEQVTVPITVSGTSVYLRIGTPTADSDYTRLAHLALELTGGGGGGDFATALATWEAQMVAYGPGIEGGRKYHDQFQPPAALGQLASVNHYDPIRVYYNVRDYTADPSWDDVIATAKYQYRDLYALPSIGLVLTYEQFTAGMLLDYERTGDALSRDTVSLVATSGYGGGLTKTSLENDLLTNHWRRSRDVAFSLMTSLDSERLGWAHRDITDWLVEWAIKHIHQWCDPLDPLFAHQCVARQPFMIGLTLRALIYYYDLYRDVLVPPAIKLALDYLWDNVWIAAELAYPYWDQSTAGIKVDPVCNVFPYDWDMYDGPFQPEAAPDLALLIAPSYAWYAAYTSDAGEKTTYRSRFEDQFIGSTAAGGTGGPGLGVVHSQKVYNQSYLYAMDGLNWRERSLAEWPAATAYTLTAPSPASGTANRPSMPFTVQLSGGAVSVSGVVTVTPSDGGAGGTFIPAAVKLTTDRPRAVFRYAPAAAADGTTVTISVTDDGGLTDPASVTYGVAGITPLATGYTVTPPVTANGPTAWSPAFTVALTPSGATPPRSCDARGGLVLVSVDDAYAGGATAIGFDSGGNPYQPGRIYLGPDQASTTFYYKPNTTDERSLRLFDDAGWTDPAYPGGLTYQASGGSPASARLFRPRLFRVR